MFAFDLQAKRKRKLEKIAEIETNDFPDYTFITEDDLPEDEKIQEEVYPYQK